MPSLMEFALSAINRNPNIANNPNAQSLVQVLRSGDADRGQQIARNICQTRGLTEQEATVQARQFFGL